MTLERNVKVDFDDTESNFSKGTTQGLASKNRWKKGSKQYIGQTNVLLFFRNRVGRNTEAICQDKRIQSTPQVVIKDVLRNGLHLCYAFVVRYKSRRFSYEKL